MSAKIIPFAVIARSESDDTCTAGRTVLTHGVSIRCSAVSNLLAGVEIDSHFGFDTANERCLLNHQGSQ